MDEWLPEQVEEFLIEAAYTNEAMPDPERKFLNFVFEGGRERGAPSAPLSIPTNVSSSTA